MRANLTQLELSISIGVTPSMISLWERGKVPNRQNQIRLKKLLPRLAKTTSRAQS